MKPQLERIAQEVAQLIVDKQAQISTVVETGYDELGFVGTSDAYLRLVKEVLTFLVSAEQGELSQWRAGTIEIQGTTQVNGVFDSTCEVVVDTLGLVGSEQDTKAVSHYCKQSSPLSEPFRQ